MTIEIVTETPLLRHGLAELLKKVPNFSVYDGRLSPSTSPAPAGDSPHTTILITDPGDELPDLLVAPILDERPDSKVVVLTDSDDHLFLWKVLTSGAHACLAMGVQLEELVCVIQAVHRKEDRFILSAPVGTLRKLRPTTVAPGPLTNREVEIMRLVAAGMSNRRISEQLFISETTVKRHLTNVYAKLDVNSRVQAIQQAFGRDLAEGSDA
ncbi:response regulator transcription factor [Micromonospora sp. H61]|jgi:DNA-binding NarL/FixJ family response regulator|uniref:response regulator transcription factor n=1 Tax=Micromonospora sp. H61 TaxID=2824888 RepID=UPI001B3795A8|nr:response regulator transcription factor [Micromonospora sp. H61]MBQ0994699.1 response regulator transcription factor [Micromonospora sp. H61]